VYHDNLTDSLNRVSLQEYMKDTTKTVSLAILDIKEFSKINNIYGEYAGDEILKRFANALGELFSDEHYITYRISGDKFAILNKESIEENEYKKIIRSKVNSFIDKPLSVVVNHEVLDIVLQCIVGIAKGAASEKLIEHADMALNNAKVRCKQIVIYSEELHIEDVYKEDMRITQEVKSAIKEDRVVPFFQLIEKGEEKSYECLVRIKNSDGSILPPNKFLPVIMQTGYYTKITKIMIEKSFEYFSKTDYSFSINLSFKDISSTSIREFIKTKIEEYNIESQLILEILESESIENFDIVRDFIKDMKSLGVKIAIDDFGSGYSNFTYLIEVKPDFVKIDGSLIKDMDNDQNAYIMVKNISRFLKEMNLKTIAEYVHSKDIYDITKELDFDGIQGYYLSEPLEDVL
jgi:c-di-GMP phosphodiesterase